MSRVDSWLCAVLAIALGGCRTGSGNKTNTSPALVQAAPIRYSLPATTLVVELQVERANESPGKYCDFLDLFFPELDHNAACQTGEASDPGKDLVAGKARTTIQGYGVTMRGTPDASRTHNVSFDASWHVDRTDSMTFTEGGTLTGAEMQRADRTGEIVLGVLSNVARIAGRFVFGGGGTTDALARSEIPWVRHAGLKENFSLLSPARQRAYTVLWGTPEGRVRLMLGARSYENIGADLSALDTVLKGTGAQGAQTLVAELRKQIGDRLADNFLGSKTKDTWNPTYEFTTPAPVAGALSSGFPLFNFAGCGVTSEATQPVKNTLAVLRCGDAHGAQESEISFVVKTASGKVATRVGSLDKTDQPGEPGEDVLYHVRPEPVTLNLTGDCRADVTLSGKPPKPSTQSRKPCNIVAQHSLLAQWGVQASIPKAGKDWAYTVTLYEATGAVKSIKLSSKAALDKATIDSAFGIATTLLDAKDAAAAEAKKKADAAATAADELTVLTRARQILDEKAKIKKLCLELGLTNCES